MPTWYGQLWACSILPGICPNRRTGCLVRNANIGENEYDNNTFIQTILENEQKAAIVNLSWNFSNLLWFFHQKKKFV